MLLSEANEEAGKYQPCDFADPPEVIQLVFSKRQLPRLMVKRMCRAVKPDARRSVGDCEGCKVRTSEEAK